MRILPLSFNSISNIQVPLFKATVAYPLNQTVKCTNSPSCKLKCSVKNIKIKIQKMECWLIDCPQIGLGD